jgi:hypothetical protein
VRNMLLATLLISGGFVALIALAIAHSLHRALPDQSTAPVEPRSLVHVLGSPEELHAAIERAANFERNVAAAALDRAGRYEDELSQPRIALAAKPASEGHSDDSVSAA